MHVSINIQSMSSLQHPSNMISIVFTCNPYMEIVQVFKSSDSILPFSYNSQPCLNPVQLCQHSRFSSIFFYGRY